MALVLCFSLMGCSGAADPQPEETKATVISEQTEAGQKSSEAGAQREETKPAETESIQSESTAESAETEPEETESALDPDGAYTSKEDVALYLYLYGELPDNFITKKEARALGWEGGSLEPYAPGKCIGGDKFGNYEGLLPEENGRTYKECDIDTLYADSRGAKRIVYSNDGLIYYTEDHYESFELVYPEDDD